MPRPGWPWTSHSASHQHIPGRPGRGTPGRTLPGEDSLQSARARGWRALPHHNLDLRQADLHLITAPSLRPTRTTTNSASRPPSTPSDPPALTRSIRETASQRRKRQQRHLGHPRRPAHAGATSTWLSCSCITRARTDVAPKATRAGSGDLYAWGDAAYLSRRDGASGSLEHRSRPPSITLKLVSAQTAPPLTSNSTAFEAPAPLNPSRRSR